MNFEHSSLYRFNVFHPSYNKRFVGAQRRRLYTNTFQSISAYNYNQISKGLNMILLLHPITSPSSIREFTTSYLLSYYHTIKQAIRKSPKRIRRVIPSLFSHVPDYNSRFFFKKHTSNVKFDSSFQTTLALLSSARLGRPLDNPVPLLPLHVVRIKLTILCKFRNNINILITQNF